MKCKYCDEEIKRYKKYDVNCIDKVIDSLKPVMEIHKDEEIKISKKLYDKIQEENKELEKNGKTIVSLGAKLKVID